MGDAVLDASTLACERLHSPNADTLEDAGGDTSTTRGFWRLPPEIRNAIYEELLVTDCAFRLGHHGPYSHEKRKKLYPAILRTSSQAYHEAVAILYGSNTFFLGPLGFKPTYSASFVASIGTPNALRIRTVVAHCIHPQLLTQSYLSRWFTALGLDYPRLKIIAVSFSTAQEDTKPRIVSIPPPPTQFQLPTNLPVLGSQWPGTPSAGVATTPPAVVVSGVLPGTGSGTAGTGTTTGAGGGGGHVRVDSAREDMLPETELDRAVARSKGWLEKRKRSEVDGLVALRNTDLRAGDDWLVYVSPAVKKRMGVKLW
ncbi:uncharacterized protein PV09_07271 [Verruconis gallopava]|uniref:Uncharacterized protein n=1 Tax=Verruconis gallopava TaxID=253628 RepID=A0A0D2A354_9PEZI|nr:uncharacterized protein PV09_07271 [Verruconis gallopava]KIW01228.1 hypothetical protein PV09_07271 [Verruconis gallopava]